MYYKEAVGAIIVYDANRNPTFEAVKKWKKDIDEKVTLKEQPIPCILLANKEDLLQTKLDKAQQDAQALQQKMQESATAAAAAAEAAAVADADLRSEFEVRVAAH